MSDAKTGKPRRPKKRRAAGQFGGGSQSGFASQSMTDAAARARKSAEAEAAENRDAKKD